MSDEPKRFITAQQLLEDSLEIGRQILESGFRPNYIVGVWRGGTPVGIMVQELLDFYGVETDHISIRTSSYASVDDRRSTPVRVHGLSYLIKSMNAEDSLLIVDDVYDTGLSVKAVIDRLKKRCRRNCPEDIRIATAYYKPGRNRTDTAPHFCARETDEWLVFPHEMDGLTRAEMAAHKPHLLSVIDSLEGIAKPVKLKGA